MFLLLLSPHARMRVRTQACTHGKNIYLLYVSLVLILRGRARTHYGYVIRLQTGVHTVTLFSELATQSNHRLDSEIQ